MMRQRRRIVMKVSGFLPEIVSFISGIVMVVALIVEVVRPDLINSRYYLSAKNNIRFLFPSTEESEEDEEDEHIVASSGSFLQPQKSKVKKEMEKLKKEKQKESPKKQVKEIKAEPQSPQTNGEQVCGCTVHSC